MSDEDNSSNNSCNFQDNEDDEYSEIDEDRPTLIQINRKMEKERKKQNIMALKKKRLRTEIATDITYDQNKKKLINCFCPDIEELTNFLEHCEIREIKDEKELKILNISKEKMFDPDEFIKKNYQKEEYKSFLNVEDVTLLSNNKKFNYPEHLNAIEESYIPKPQIEDKSELIKNIVNNDILNIKQKEELNKLILQIKNTNIKNIIKNDKLEIVFDLDNTCILGFISNPDIYKSLSNQFPNKKLKLISFKFKEKFMFSCIIIRNGLSEFLEFSNKFCNFYINTLGIEKYGLNIMLMLEKITGIQFKKFKGRNENIKDNRKYLKDLDLDIKKTIIFDDKPSVWIEDNLNVILSKKFTDKDCENYLEKHHNNPLLNFLFNYFPFYYYKSKKNNYNQIIWKKQKLYGGRTCPFYQFSENNTNNNYCLSGEYLESKKYQFNYMKDVIKIIYYLVFYYDIHVPDALKLIRYNIFYKTYFNLNFYKGEGKEILKDIIENCGGQIINKDNDINYDNEKVFFVCKNDDYPSQKDKIKKECLIYINAKIVNEKYILDSFYFMTNLENELNDMEYSLNNKNKDDDYYDY